MIESSSWCNYNINSLNPDCQRSQLDDSSSSAPSGPIQTQPELLTLSFECVSHFISTDGAQKFNLFFLTNKFKHIIMKFTLWLLLIFVNPSQIFFLFFFVLRFIISINLTVYFNHSRWSWVNDIQLYKFLSSAFYYFFSLTSFPTLCSEFLAAYRNISILYILNSVNKSHIYLCVFPHEISCTIYQSLINIFCSSEYWIEIFISHSFFVLLV